MTVANYSLIDRNGERQYSWSLLCQVSNPHTIFFMNDGSGSNEWADWALSRLCKALTLIVCAALVTRSWLLIMLCWWWRLKDRSGYNATRMAPGCQSCESNSNVSMSRGSDAGPGSGLGPVSQGQRRSASLSASHLGNTLRWLHCSPEVLVLARSGPNVSHIDL